jgi:hypothetical protein
MRMKNSFGISGVDFRELVNNWIRKKTPVYFENGSKRVKHNYIGFKEKAREVNYALPGLIWNKSRLLVSRGRTGINPYEILEKWFRKQEY